MKKKSLVFFVVALLTGAAYAQDITVNIQVTIPESKKDELVAVIDTLPPLYTNVATVVTNGAVVRTNMVRTVVVETPKNKFKRISASRVAAYWKVMLLRTRQDAIVSEDAVSTE
jgi:hypothetical protein